MVTGEARRTESCHGRFEDFIIFSLATGPVLGNKLGNSQTIERTRGLTTGVTGYVVKMVRSPQYKVFPVIKKTIPIILTPAW